MSALTQFQANIAPADQLVSMYRELRLSRGLGSRGRLSQANTDLLWLPRSAVVAAISALDTYVHHVLYERIPVCAALTPIPESLAHALAGIFPVRNGKDFQAAQRVLASQSSLGDLCAKYRAEKLEFASYQSPDKIEDAYKLIGVVDVFDSVSAIWQGPNSTSADIRRTLAHYVRRRNQIAHEGDREGGGATRAMQPDYATHCREFVTALVSRLNRVVYAV